MSEGMPANVRVLAKRAPVAVTVLVEVMLTEVNSLSATPTAQRLTAADPELRFSTAPLELLRIVPAEKVIPLFDVVKLEVAPALTLMLLPDAAVKFWLPVVLYVVPVKVMAPVDVQLVAP